MEWAQSELEHVGRIVSVENKDLQYSYALSTLNGMAHLKDALAQMVADVAYKHAKQDLLRIHDKVIRVMKHLVKDFDLDLNAIRKFNTRKVLSSLSYLKNGSKRSNKTRRNK
jgi:hypothetical protein